MPKSKYETHVLPKLPLIEMWARNGLSQDEIAENLGIHRASFYRYINEHSDLRDTLYKGREVADAIVENQAFKLCLGYEYKEENMTPQGIPMELKKIRHPDGAMIRWWLSNRVSDRWNNKQDVNLSGELKQVVIVNDLEDESDHGQS